MAPLNLALTLALSVYQTASQAIIFTKLSYRVIWRVGDQSHWRRCYLPHNLDVTEVGDEQY
ncbi:MAG: hypothetical protein CSH37_08300 [Thalassolituus sp.]|nr:MAG: hypothetical protein CSH37_08300 [Thalassolituus sp.]